MLSGKHARSRTVHSTDDQLVQRKLDRTRSPLCALLSNVVVAKAKTEQVMQLTAQRNSAKNRADSLAKDLSRVCGGGRTVDQIEAIVTKYVDERHDIMVGDAASPTLS